MIIVSVLASLIHLGDVYNAIDMHWLNFFSSITFTNNFFPQYISNLVPVQWSIAVEMFFYIIFPLLFIRIKSLKSALKYYFIISLISTSAAVLVTILFRSIQRPIWIDSIYYNLYFSLPFQIPHFILGIVGFFLIKEDFKKSFKTILIIFGWNALMVAIWGFSQYLNRGTSDIFSMLSPRLYIESTFLLAFIYLLSKFKLSIFDNFITRYLGKISYSIYLLHFLVLTVISPFVINFKYFSNLNIYEQYLGLFIIASMVTASLASITFKFIEEPGQRLGKYVFEYVKINKYKLNFKNVYNQENK